MKEDIFNWYKKGFESLPQETPPPMIWENVEAALDGKPNRRKPLGIWWWTSGLFILLVSAGILISKMNSGSNENTANVNSSNVGKSAKNESVALYNKSLITTDLNSNSSITEIEKAEVKSNTAESNEISVQETVQPKSGLYVIPVVIEEEIAQINSTIEMPKEANKLNNVNQSEIKQPLLVEIPEEELVEAPSQSNDILSSLSAIEITNQPIPLVLNSKEENFPAFVMPSEGSNGPRWSFGIASEVNNNWLFNHDFVDALRKESNNSIMPHFSSTWSFSAAKEFLPGQSIRTEFIVSKREGQHYLIYSEGMLQQKTIHLNYSGATILYDHAKLNSRIFLGIPLRTHWLVGTSVCYLSESTFAFGGQVTNPLGYRKMNVSLVGGFEKEMLFSKHLSFGTGLRLYGGLTNIFKGYENIPSWFNRTHTGNIAWTFSLRYTIGIPKH